MGFRYQLRSPSGDDLGEGEYTFDPAVGDEIYFNGPRRARVTAVVPVALVEEHISRPLYGILEIEPLDKT